MKKNIKVIGAILIMLFFLASMVEPTWLWRLLTLLVFQSSVLLFFLVVPLYKLLIQRKNFFEIIEIKNRSPSFKVYGSVISSALFVGMFLVAIFMYTPLVRDSVDLLFTGGESINEERLIVQTVSFSPPGIWFLMQDITAKERDIEQKRLYLYFSRYALRENTLYTIRYLSRSRTILEFEEVVQERGVE